MPCADGRYGLARANEGECGRLPPLPLGWTSRLALGQSYRGVSTTQATADNLESVKKPNALSHLTPSYARGLEGAVKLAT